MKKTSHIKPTYKAIMLDVDGTTVAHDKINAMPSKRVIEAITKAQDLGIHVCLATGRPYESAAKIIKALGLKGLLSMMNGSQIVEAKTGKVIWEKRMTLTMTHQVLKVLKKYNIRFLINEDCHDLDTPKNYKPKKPYAFCTYGQTEEMTEVIKKEFSKIKDLDYHTFEAWPTLGEGIVIAGNHIKATKQQGILQLSKILGVSTHEIIGVGDNYNDFPMMMACGLRVAMGNAVPELKEIADYIAPSVADDGVADVIEKYILNP